MKVLIVAAHADDEALGCGGTIALHADAGDDIAALFMTDGVGSRTGSGNIEAQARTSAMESALFVLGVAHHKAFDFPDNAMDSVSFLQIPKAIEDFCSVWGVPDIVYTHHDSDLNIDHRITRTAALTCFRPQPSMNGLPSRILSFEVLSSTGWGGHTPNPFQPNYFVDISATLRRKLTAINAYAEEMRPWPHARSVESVDFLARHRGAAIGIEAAEAFVVERIINRFENHQVQ